MPVTPSPKCSCEFAFAGGHDPHCALSFQSDIAVLQAALTRSEEARILAERK